jgi:hypothetical protein
MLVSKFKKFLDVNKDFYIYIYIHKQVAGRRGIPAGETAAAAGPARSYDVGGHARAAPAGAGGQARAHTHTEISIDRWIEPAGCCHAVQRTS